MKNLAAHLAVIVAAGTAQLALANDFPTRTVRIVVAQPPGGTVDTTARILAQDLSAKWGQPVVVENKPGAGGNIGGEHVAMAPKDGYTLMISPLAQHTINPWLYKSLPFDPIAGFAPVTMIGSTPMVLMVHPSLPVKNVAEYLALAKAKPGTITYSSAGNGTYNHLAGESLALAAGVSLSHVPYRGVAPALQDVVGGHINSTIGTVPSVQSLIAAGKLRPIAVTTAKRSKALPDVPTFAESGVAGYDIAVRVALMAPAGTPPEVIEKLNKDVGAALKSPEVASELEKRGLEIDVGSPKDLADAISTEAAGWGRTIKERGISLN
jgi:tripartite-type tricarboxylate transporter receptor subunit TctC